MLEVFIGNVPFYCSDLSEVRGVLKTAPVGVRCQVVARNPQDEWTTYLGSSTEIRAQLDEEWSAYKIAHRAFWGY